MKKIYVMAMVIIAILLGGNSVKAQFSPDCLDNTWTKQPCWNTTMTFPNGVVCDVVICYCTRIVNGVRQVYVSGVGYGDACALGIDDVNSILDAATHRLLNGNPMNWPCPPCPQSVINTEVSFSTCYKLENDPIAGIVWIRPCNALGVCTQSYTVCCSLTGVKTITLISTSSTGSCVGESGCISRCP